MLAMTQPTEFQKWVLDELKKRPRGTRAALADYVGITRDKLTRSLNWAPDKEPRRIPYEEAEKIKRFFEENPVGQAAKEKSNIQTLIDLAPSLSDAEARTLIEVIRALRRGETGPESQP